MPRILLVSMLAALCSLPCAAQSDYSETLARRGGLGIPLEQAKRLEARIGQLLIVNVDGFGYSGKLALEPGFVPMVESLRIGGVIPHYGSTDFQRIRDTNEALARMTELPLLICADIVRLSSGSNTAAFGDGYVGGFLGKYRRLPDHELQTLAALNAYTFAALGINVALGPTVDSSTRDPRTAARARLVIQEMRRFDIEPVLKHFPFLPTGANLHHQSPDTRVPLLDAQARFSVFRELADEAGILMTTHLLDSRVDRSIVTFSAPWNAILTRETGFRGLLMSDGLLMLANYTDRSVLSGGPTGPSVAGLDSAAVWAIRALLAGHDLVIVEGSAAQTYRVFRGILTAASRDTELGRNLRERIEQSYDRIVAFKRQREPQLRRHVEVPTSTIRAVIAALPPEGADLASFRFSAESLAALQPDLNP